MVGCTCRDRNPRCLGAEEVIQCHHMNDSRVWQWSSLFCLYLMKKFPSPSNSPPPPPPQSPLSVSISLSLCVSLSESLCLCQYYLSLCLCLCLYVSACLPASLPLSLSLSFLQPKRVNLSERTKQNKNCVSKNVAACPSLRRANIRQ